ncbi:MAG: NmrA family NAD(P)-binding protein [Rhizobacter sp.]
MAGIHLLPCDSHEHALSPSIDIIDYSHHHCDVRHHLSAVVMPTDGLQPLKEPTVSRPKILVTGATGKTGQAVARQLLQEQWPVRALVHREDGRSDALRRLGADVLVADMFNPQQMAKAMDGVRRAYFVTLFKPGMVRAAQAFADAARQTRLETVVQLSQWLSHPTHPSIQTRETWQVDQLMEDIGDTDHIIVNPGMFADNFLRVIDFASLLYFYPVLTADSSSAPVANEDIARVVVALLKQPEGLAGKRFRPTGPRLLTGREMARVIAQVVGHRVLPVDLPMWMFRKAARQSGADIHEVYNYGLYMQEHRRGTFSYGGGVTDVLERLTGAPAESFEATAARYAAMPFARQSFANRIKAFARFNVLPLVPAHDLKAYERRMGFVTPEDAPLSIDDPAWKLAHKAQMDEQGIDRNGRPVAPGQSDVRPRAAVGLMGQP